MKTSVTDCMCLMCIKSVNVYAYVCQDLLLVSSIFFFFALLFISPFDSFLHRSFLQDFQFSIFIKIEQIHFKSQIINYYTKILFYIIIINFIIKQNKFDKVISLFYFRLLRRIIRILRL